MQQQDWQTLTCTECPSIHMLQVFHLRYKAGGGTTPQPGGYQCAQCGAAIDTATLIRRADLKRLEREIQEKKDEYKESVDLRVMEEEHADSGSAVPGEDLPKRQKGTTRV